MILGTVPAVLVLSRYCPRRLEGVPRIQRGRMRRMPASCRHRHGTGSGRRDSGSERQDSGRASGHGLQAVIAGSVSAVMTASGMDAFPHRPGRGQSGTPGTVPGTVDGVPSPHAVIKRKIYVFSVCYIYFSMTRREPAPAGDSRDSQNAETGVRVSASAPVDGSRMLQIYCPYCPLCHSEA